MRICRSILPLYASIDRLDQRLVEAGRDMRLRAPNISAHYPSAHHARRDRRLNFGIRSFNGGLYDPRTSRRWKRDDARFVHRDAVPYRSELAGRRRLVRADGRHVGLDGCVFRSGEGTYEPVASAQTAGVGTSHQRWRCASFPYAPIILLVIFSFSASRIPGQWGGFTTEWYATLFDDSRLQRTISVSVRVALVSTLIATVLGTTAALALERFTFRGRRVFGVAVPAHHHSRRDDGGHDADVLLAVIQCGRCRIRSESQGFRHHRGEPSHSTSHSSRWSCERASLA